MNIFFPVYDIFYFVALNPLTCWGECMLFLDHITGIQVEMLIFTYIVKPVFIKVQCSKALIFEFTEIQNASLK